MKKVFFDQFESYCITPGIDSGKARSYSKAIQYLCDYLKITQIDKHSVEVIKGLANEINDKNSNVYKNLLLFLSGRRQKSYLEKGFIKAALTYFFDYCKENNL